MRLKAQGLSVSSIPLCVTIKMPLMRKATGYHLIKSTHKVLKNSEPCPWLLLRLKASMQRGSSMAIFLPQKKQSKISKTAFDPMAESTIGKNIFLTKLGFFEKLQLHYVNNKKWPAYLHSCTRLNKSIQIMLHCASTLNNYIKLLKKSHKYLIYMQLI